MDITLVLSFGLASLAAGEHTTQDSVPAPVRMVDVDGDGRLDRLQLGPDGALRVALNLGRREFEPIVQGLPRVDLVDVLAADLNGDGHADLYLVAEGENAALVGDGTGRFTEATRELGLADAGRGRAAEVVDIDGDGRGDLLLHNASGDVVFWGEEAGAFVRDSATPVAPAPNAVPLVSLPERSTDGDAARSQVGTRAVDGVAEKDRSLQRAGHEAARVAAPAARRSESPGAAPTDSRERAYAAPVTTCMRMIKDATTNDCLEADSTPTLGRLYPLGPEFSITPGGLVGINDTTPDTELDVTGDVRATGAYFVETTGRAVHSSQTGMFGGASSHTFDPIIPASCSNPAAVASSRAPTSPTSGRRGPDTRAPRRA